MMLIMKRGSLIGTLPHGRLSKQRISIDGIFLQNNVHEGYVALRRYSFRIWPHVYINDPLKNGISNANKGIYHDDRRLQLACCIGLLSNSNYKMI